MVSRYKPASQLSGMKPEAWRCTMCSCIASALSSASNFSLAMQMFGMDEMSANAGLGPNLSVPRALITILIGLRTNCSGCCLLCLTFLWKASAGVCLSLLKANNPFPFPRGQDFHILDHSLCSHLDSHSLGHISLKLNTDPKLQHGLGCT